MLTLIILLFENGQNFFSGRLKLPWFIKKKSSPSQSDGSSIGKIEKSILTKDYCIDIILQILIKATELAEPEGSEERRLRTRNLHEGGILARTLVPARRTPLLRYHQISPSLPLSESLGVTTIGAGSTEGVDWLFPDEVKLSNDERFKRYCTKTGKSFGPSEDFL